MGNKTQKQSKRFSCGELRERAERSLKKLDFKQAYKDAKLCYQQDPAPAHRDLLERAWFQRAMALHRAGLGAESRDLAQGLLDFGVTQPEVLQGLPDLLTAVGLLDRALGGKVGPTVEVRPELLAAAADRAVLSPSTAPKSLPEIAPGAAQVRAALEALYAGDEAAAFEPMKAVPRSSPFADWRLFVRGLAAFYRDDPTEAQAHWDRLEPGRAAAKIAASLRALSSGGNGAKDAGEARRSVDLEITILGGSLTTYLQQIQASLAEEDGSGAVKVLKRCRAALQRVAPEIVGRIERLLVAAFVNSGDEESLEDLCRVAAPLPIDPRWNRTWALLLEHPEIRELDEAEQRWRQYLEDLANLPGWTAEERSMAQAMVWERIGSMRASEAQKSYGPWDDEDSRNQDREESLRCFREAIRLFPGFRPAYRSLSRHCLAWGRGAEAADAMRGLLEHYPDDLDALQSLYHHHARRQEPMAARDYALRAWRLKPANPELMAMARKARLAAARQFALDGQWEQGRAEFAAAERLGTDSGESYQLLAAKAIFEIKAGDEASGKRLMGETLAALDNPLPAYLLLLIEAIRYDLPYRLDGILGDLECQFQRGLSRKPDGKSAGRLCRILTDFLCGEVDYHDRATHLKQVLAYVKRCGRIRWEVGDLRDVCGFLQALPKSMRTPEWHAVYNKLLRRGMKLFPESPDFPIMAATHEIEKGPRRCNRMAARRFLELGRDLARKAGPEFAAWLETAESQLAFLDEFSGPLWRFGRILDGLGEEDDGEDDDEDEGEAFDARDVLPPAPLLAEFFEICRKLGLNPVELLDMMANGEPCPFPVPDKKGGPSRGRGKANR